MLHALVYELWEKNCLRLYTWYKLSCNSLILDENMMSLSYHGEWWCHTLLEIHQRSLCFLYGCFLWTWVWTAAVLLLTEVVGLASKWLDSFFEVKPHLVSMKHRMMHVVFFVLEGSNCPLFRILFNLQAWFSWHTFSKEAKRLIMTVVPVMN